MHSRAKCDCNDMVPIKSPFLQLSQSSTGVSVLAPQFIKYSYDCSARTVTILNIDFPALSHVLFFEA